MIITVDLFLQVLHFLLFLFLYLLLCYRFFTFSTFRLYPSYWLTQVGSSDLGFRCHSFCLFVSINMEPWIFSEVLMKLSMGTFTRFPSCHLPTTFFRNTPRHLEVHGIRTSIHYEDEIGLSLIPRFKDITQFDSQRPDLLLSGSSSNLRNFFYSFILCA